MKRFEFIHKRHRDIVNKIRFYLLELDRINEGLYGHSDKTINYKRILENKVKYYTIKLYLYKDKWNNYYDNIASSEEALEMIDLQYSSYMRIGYCETKKYIDLTIEDIKIHVSL